MTTAPVTQPTFLAKPNQSPHAALAISKFLFRPTYVCMYVMRGPEYQVGNMKFYNLGVDIQGDQIAPIFA
jgi:hypothetical protein